MTSVKEYDESNSILVYPNPVDDKLAIEFSVEESAHFTINLTNSFGKEVEHIFSNYLTQGLNHLEYDLSRLAAGIYFLRVESNGGVRTIRIVKD